MVFSTKDRTPWLKNSDVRQQLYAYMATILRDNVDSPALVINGIEDHVHVLCLLSRKFAIKDLIQEAKTETTKWLKRQSPLFASFAWQAGYGAFSVSESKVPDVREYIKNQEEHHRRMSFQDEFRLICQRHAISLDERYVWDKCRPVWGSVVLVELVPRAMPWADMVMARWAARPRF